MGDFDTNEESTRSGGSDSAPDLREMVSHPYVVEVLDALSRGPMRLADICANVPAGRRGLAVALRIAAARGLVTKNDNGSWDTSPPDDTVYQHTDRGRQLVETLSRFSVWTTMFDRAPDHCWKR